MRIGEAGSRVGVRLLPRTFQNGAKESESDPSDFPRHQPPQAGREPGICGAGSCLQGCLWLSEGRGLGLGRKRALPPNKEPPGLQTWLFQVQPICNRCWWQLPAVGGGAVQQVGMPLQVREDLTRESSTFPVPKLLPWGEGIQLGGRAHPQPPHPSPPIHA